MVGLEVSGVRLKQFDKGRSLVFGVDETLERRRGKHIRASGIYRDPARSSQAQCVKASGLRWMSVMWLTRVRWAERMWALPVLTTLAASERYYEARGRTAKRITDWAWPLVYPLRRWLPNRRLILVGDSSYAALDFLHACQILRSPVTVITRLRLDAALYETARPYAGRGRPRKKGARLPTPQQRLADPVIPWQRLPVVWYDHPLRDIDICPFQAVWYHPGLPVVPIRFVLIRDPFRHFPPQAILSTDP